MAPFGSFPPPRSARILIPAILDGCENCVLDYIASRGRVLPSFLVFLKKDGIQRDEFGRLHKFTKDPDLVELAVIDPKKMKADDAIRRNAFKENAPTVENESSILDIPRLRGNNSDEESDIPCEDARESEDEFSRMMVSQYKQETSQTAEMINRNADKGSYYKY